MTRLLGLLLLIFGTKTVCDSSTYGQEKLRAAVPVLLPLESEPYVATRLVGGTEQSQDLLFSTDGKWLWTATNQAQVRQWDTSEWKVEKDYSQFSIGGQQKSKSGFVSLHFIQNTGTLLATAHDAIELIQVNSEISARKGFGGTPLIGCKSSPDGKWFVAVGGDSLLAFPLDSMINDVGDLVLQSDSKMREPIALKEQITSFDFVGNDRIAVGFEGFHGTAARTEILHFPSGTKTELHYPGAIVVCAPNGRWLATDRVLVDLHAKPMQAKRLVDAHRVTAITFSGDSAWFATGGEDGRIMIWDSATARQIATIDAHIRKVDSLSISPDGRWLASTGSSHIEDRWPKIWDAVKIRAKKPKGLEQRIVSADHKIRQACIMEGS